MSKERFGFVASWLVVGLIATGFLQPRYSLISFVPLFIVACLAYAFFKYEKSSDDARTQVIGILAICVFGAYFHYERMNDYKRLMGDVFKECSQYSYIDELDRRPFSEICTRARNWELDRREPPLGHWW